MRKIALLFSIVVLPSVVAASGFPMDSVSAPSRYLDEITIICNPKVETKLFDMPGSVTLLGISEIQQANIRSVKDVSTLAANLFIPDYGSRLITSAYIRGIGSRINSPAVGLSVNNIPYLDKSAYDCDWLDIARIEVLRGPQGTLYGRNTMAGLINIYTHSPLDRQGTHIRLGGGNHSLWSITANTSHKLADHLALAVGARYESRDGYFTNTLTGKNSGKTYSASGRFQLDWQSSPQIKWSLSADFEHSYQDGYPYAPYDKTSGAAGDISYDAPSSYLRNLLSTGLTFEYRHDYFYLTTVTGYQYLDDDMRLDQDFTPLSIYTLQQKQHLHALSQELAIKSHSNEHWQWVTGIFGAYQNLNTKAPVDFRNDGIRLLVEGQGNAALAALKEANPSMPEISMSVDNENLLIDGTYRTPSFSLATFGQVEAKHIFGSNISASIGARLEYEHIRIEHDTRTTDNLAGTALVSMGNMPLSIPFSAPLDIEGATSQESTEFLPKAEVKYTLRDNLMAYASISRGYRSGGYNYQMFSNLIQSQMSSRIISSVADGAISQISALLGESPAADKVITTVKNILQGSDAQDKADLIDQAIAYRPEHSWNYEIGVRGNLWNRRLYADLSLFYIDCRDQQISCISGYGRVTRNSGRTESYGLEASLQAMPLHDLKLSAAYGFTHATFLNYNDGTNDYAGKYVPFAPMHTLSLTAAYTWNLPREHTLTLAAQFLGRGRIYWTEANDLSQPFYGLLDATLTYQWHWIELSLWGKNLTSARYQAFCFQTLNAENLSEKNTFIQRGIPLTFGANITFSF